MAIAHDELLRRLQSFSQDHVLAGWDKLSPEEQAAFADTLAQLDFAELRDLHSRRQHKDALPEWSRLSALPRANEGQSEHARFRTLGEDAFRRGQVAFLVVAGGQGTRLGFDLPKGMFPVGPVSGKSLFQLHAEKILALSRRYGAPLPFLIMTSPATHDDTVAFFAQNANFGLPTGDVRFFCQGTMPALDYESGKLLLEAPGQLSLSPNGHGGTLAALNDSGVLAQLEAASIRTIFYFQVDNPLTNLADAVFLGRHLEQRAEVSSKALPKKHPTEKMGNYVLRDGRCSIIEYSDLPDDWAHRKDDADQLFFWAGNPAIHLLDVAFLRRLCNDLGASLPWHLAKKKVPYLDDQGQLVQPDKENALKFERFIFDTLPLAERWTVAATTREDDFEPLKNATGPDSPETVRAALIRQAADWLEYAGAVVPRDAAGVPTVALEISPLAALDRDAVQRMVAPGTRITEPYYLAPPPSRG